MLRKTEGASNRRNLGACGHRDGHSVRESVGIFLCEQNPLSRTPLARLLSGGRCSVSFVVVVQRLGYGTETIVI